MLRKFDKILAKRNGVCYTNSMLQFEKYKGKRICVAVSGGMDSIALLHYLKELAPKYGFLLSAVHCEHGIRGEESVADMRFVSTICKEWGIPLTVFFEKCPVRAKEEKESLETVARNFRYESFTALLRRRVDYIATAHHENDEAETVLFRLARGAGLRGMSAMKEENGQYIRPFLHLSKADICDYVQAHSLSYREDSTNQQTEATRNKLRLEILPKLEEAIPGAVGNLANFAFLAAEDDELLCALAKPLLSSNAWEITVGFSDKKPLFTRACLMAMQSLGLVKDYTSRHLNALWNLQGLERGSGLDLPKTLRAEKTETGIRFFYPAEEEEILLGKEQPFTLEGFDGGMYEVSVSLQPIEESQNEWKILRLDRGKLPKNAVFRFRREGDFIRRFGGGTKSLKKLLNEEKVPVGVRAYLPLLAEADSGRVYAVCGVEISEDVKIGKDTKEIVYLLIRKKEKNGYGKA